jgi:solute carrier family 25 protein 33/36
MVHLISAATAGLVTSTATNPIWVVKTRLQLQGNTRRYKNSLDCVMHILREEGTRGLYKGMSASYLGKKSRQCQLSWRGSYLSLLNS